MGLAAVAEWGPNREGSGGGVNHTGCETCDFRAAELHSAAAFYQLGKESRSIFRG